jgi:glycosyltransferase involved in cell wall biosynthesis
MKVIAVVPSYNEAGRIGAVIRALLPRVGGVIVVDDGSSDESVAEATAAGARVIRHVLNRGQGAALKTGTLAALADGADVVIHFDADGQHDPDAVPTLLAPISGGSADVVLGSRFLGVTSEGMPISRRLLLVAARQFSGLALGIPHRFTDPQSGMRAMTAWRTVRKSSDWSRGRRSVRSRCR